MITSKKKMIAAYLSEYINFTRSIEVIKIVHSVNMCDVIIHYQKSAHKSFAIATVLFKCLLTELS